MIFKFALRLLKVSWKFEIWNLVSGDHFNQASTAGVSAEIISNPPFIVLYSSLCSRTLRSLRSLRFNHSNATGIDIIWSKLSKISKSWSSWVISNISRSVAERLQLTRRHPQRRAALSPPTKAQIPKLSRKSTAAMSIIQSLWHRAQSRLAVAGGGWRLGSRGSFEAKGWCVGWSWKFP